MTANDGGDDTRTDFDQLSPQAMAWVNQQCDEFEKCWRKEIPSLANFVLSIDASDTEPLFAVLCYELIAIDVQHRQQRQLECSKQRYWLQFPQLDKHQIVRIFEETISPNADDPLSPNQQLGDYVIKERIGCGGMGAVYLGEHRLMGRQVAIKVLSGRAVNDRTSQQRFLREVRSFAKLSHPNVVSAFDARLEGESLYLVTEWIQGEDLAKKVSRCGHLPVREAMEYCRQAALGLHYAHSQGVVHRDVKPSNLLLDSQGLIKILDLGLSRWILEDDDVATETLTKSMNLMGTAGYMSPEQARTPAGSNQQSDIYSLGCTLFFLLCGRTPYTGDSVVDILFSHARDPIPDIRKMRSEVDLGTANLIQSMLAKEPSNRPATMDEVAQQLASLLAKNRNECEFETPANIEHPQSKASRHRWIGNHGLLYGFIALLTGMVAVVALMISSPLRNLLWTEPGSVLPIDYDANAGIEMNGRSSYGEIIGFDTPLPESALIEASFTPNRSSGPANLMTWTGDRIFGLFVDQEDFWGVSFADRDQSFVEVSQVKATIGQQQLIGARYYLGAVELFVDGQRVQTRRVPYPMVAKETAFYFGGLPEGALPLDHGTRFLAGTLHRLRISTGKLPKPAAHSHDLLTIPSSTIALFQFSRQPTSHGIDESAHQLQVRLTDMRPANGL